MTRTHLLVCTGSGCRSAGSLATCKAVLAELLQAVPQPTANSERDVPAEFQAALRASGRAFQRDVAAKTSKVIATKALALVCPGGEGVVGLHAPVETRRHRRQVRQHGPEPHGKPRST